MGWGKRLFTAAALLAACATGARAAGPVPRLAAMVQTASLDPAALAQRMAQFEEGRWIMAQGGSGPCGVAVYHYEYMTVDGQGRPASASAALMVPRGTASECQRPAPLVLAIHGTMHDSSYNLADVSGRNVASPRALAWAQIYAARGYVVVAPNFAGYDTSSLDYHPYLDHRQQTRDMIDALKAARALLPQAGAVDNSKLFITGYSQGGWLAMATHRALEARGMKVTASMPASGPYPMLAVADDVFLGRPMLGSTMFFPLGITSFQRGGGGIYRRPEDLYNPRYAAGMEDLLPTTVPWPRLIEQGKVPASALFDSAPLPLPAKPSAALTALLKLAGPEHGPAEFREIHEAGFGPEPLLTNRTRMAYLQDMADHPDGAWPVWHTGRAAQGSVNPLRRAFLRGDLRGWVPRSPLIMCGGSSDAMVPFRAAGALMLRYWSTGPNRAPTGRVGLIDFDAPAIPGEPWGPLKANLQTMRGDIVAKQGLRAWYELYHISTLPRYCYTAARDWFDTMR